MKSLVLILIILNFPTLYGKTIRIAISSVPNNLNPLFSTDSNSQNIGRLTHLSLIDSDSNMKPFCRLCESYKEQILKTGEHIISFKLKKNIKFWNGEIVSAEDVKKSIFYFTSTEKSLNSIFRFSFSKIIEAKLIGPFEISLKYQNYSLENLNNLTLLKIIKYENNQIIGSGPYKYGKIEPFSFELISLRKDRPNLVFKVVKDETTLALKLLNSEIDLSLAEMSPRKINWLKTNGKEKLDFFEKESAIYKYINMNHRRKLFQDKKVRKALSLLIPREKILQYKLKDTAILSFGMLSKAFDGLYYKKEIDKYNFTEANRLLDEAGYKKNKEGIRFSLDWKVSNNRSVLEMIEVFKDYYKKAGIKVNITIQEWGTFMRGIKTGNFDIYMSQWIGFTGPDMLRFVFHSENIPPKGANRGAYINTNLDEILDKANIEGNTEKRTELYIKAQKIIADEYPYINLWHPKVIWIARSCLNKLVPYPNGGFIPLLNIESHCE